MAEYTFTCPHCGKEMTMLGPMKQGPPTTLECECGQLMSRTYKPVLAVAFNPAEVLVEWATERYNRMRARRRGKYAPDFSPERVKRPGAGIPGQQWSRK